MSQRSLSEQAVQYAAGGFPVHPLKPRSKMPLLPHGFRDASANIEQVAAWWKKWPDANIGIVTGQTSGLLVVDIDEKSGGYKSLAELENQHGPLPPTVIVKTGGGGLHYYYKFPNGASIKSSAGKIGKGIDIRADGGYVVGVPSIHPNGQKYELREDSLEQFQPAPEWLIILLTHPLAQKAIDAGIKVNLINVDKIMEEAYTATEGNRNTMLANISGSLFRCARYGLDPMLSYALLSSWNQHKCKPPLSFKEFDRTVDSIAKAELFKEWK